ncbi:heterokaryon incompatibility protein-domain-containing protein [Nemania sp. FL0031]|nr:heterokaryon incompatibility protein-domain-containing protein [Nemania sp. FL0031]
MRLINVHTLAVEEFTDDQAPRYAILSHVWGKEEVTLQEMKEGSATSREGYEKIKDCCRQARFDGLPFAWIDTCCIDKQSSAELSEAINSMYRWYENATLCYVHLADVDGVEHDGMESFRRSRYWTRGWTLQELIAPRILIFFSSGWTRIGTRLDLREVVAAATKIPKAVLRFRSMRDYSVSQKMSWASRRQTTRLEDEAYCLLGLFGVSMPLLYGEGRRAFRRLQEEIIKELEDDSIFAWQGGTDHGLLASCPAQFAFSHSIQRSIERPISDTAGDPPFAITNRGIRISLPVLENCHTVPLFSLTRASFQQYLVPNPLHLQGGVQDRVLAILNCQQSTDTRYRVAVVLNYDDSRGRFTRDVNIGLVKVSTNEIAEQATLKQLLVAAGGKSPWDDTVMDDEPERLVVIQGLSGIMAHFKFERATLLSGRELDCDVQENGTISVRFFRRRGIVVIYRSQGAPEHHCIVICLKPSDTETKIDATITHLYGQDVNKESIIRRITQAGQHSLSGRYKDGTVYETPDGTYSLSPIIREAEHASVVEVAVESLECSEVSPSSTS